MASIAVSGMCVVAILERLFAERSHVIRGSQDAHETGGSTTQLFLSDRIGGKVRGGGPTIRQSTACRPPPGQSAMPGKRHLPLEQGDRTARSHQSGQVPRLALRSRPVAGHRLRHVAKQKESQCAGSEIDLRHCQDHARSPAIQARSNC